ncbi:MAG: serine hydroxymethyltransferase [Candidatus Daviesbacteria bacterium]|nr:MAG: serine hydroxymethyltransferase [Candidatus Daviesbacteria bacterium]
MSKIFNLIEQEKERQKNGLELIPSENYVSCDVLQALGSILTDKYSEGYPGRRYYGGNQIIDEIEKEAKELVNKLFGTVYANVQPYSGSPANLAVDLGLAEPGSVIMGMNLVSGGHLTHGAPVSFTGKLFKAVQYGVDQNGRIDLDEVEKLAQENSPKIIWVGLTAYPYKLDFKGFREIADSIGAYLAADISHIAGLVVAGVHESPVPYVDVITTTTHKTLRGPRGAVILVTQKGLDRDPDLSKKIDSAIFPGLQGGPHNHTTAAMAVAFNEALSSEFKSYIEQVVKNAQVLAAELGIETENHLMLKNVGVGRGYLVEIALEAAGITVNKNTIPNEQSSPFYPSGIRLGTPAITSRGMKEDDMKKIAAWIKQVLEEIKDYDLPKEQNQRANFIKEFRAKMAENENLKKIKEEVKEFTGKYPLPGVDE